MGRSSTLAEAARAMDTAKCVSSPSFRWVQGKGGVGRGPGAQRHHAAMGRSSTLAEAARAMDTAKCVSSPSFMGRGELGEALVPKDIMQPWDAALPWLKQPGLWTQQNAASLINELQKNLPGIKGDRGQDFQWKRPLPAAKVASRDPLAQRPDRHQCEHIRLAKKKMHHFTSISRYLANKQMVEDLMRFGKHWQKPTVVER
ncbi:hypothetical protein V1264_011724 [Littorina saxatilis]|uniref:Uncharacterized protein n=1 Tax=Littorina saxatilis TaxID=31220 RepID=A0AAN9BVT7_9CAEN